LNEEQKIISANGALAQPIRMPDIRAIQDACAKSHASGDIRVGSSRMACWPTVGIPSAWNDAAIRWRQPSEVSCCPPLPTCALHKVGRLAWPRDHPACKGLPWARRFACRCTWPVPAATRPAGLIVYSLSSTCWCAGRLDARRVLILHVAWL